MKYVVRAKQLIDGTGAAPIADGGVVVVDGIIHACGAFKSLPEVDGAKVINLPDHTLAPGLIDVHSHVSIETVGPGAEHVPPNDAEVALQAVWRLGQDLRAGVTTMRTLGDRHFLDVIFKRAQRDRLIEIPRLQVAGHLLQSSLVRVSVSEITANGPTEVRRYVRESIRSGADWVKYYATPNSRADNPTQPVYAKDEVEMIFSEARMAGRPVCAHCHGGQAADWCIDLGVDSLEHGLYLDERHFSAMSQKGIVLVPTTGVILLQPDEGASARLIESKNRARNFLREARRHKVRCVPGSDAVHGRLAFEHEIMISCGWTPLEALIASTRDAAALLRIEKHTGTLESGKWADVIAFNGDPLNDIAALRDIQFVMQDGRVIRNDTARG
jgi:imidazolonepropionase-like amidohydrolase